MSWPLVKASGLNLDLWAVIAAVWFLTVEVRVVTANVWGVTAEV